MKNSLALLKPKANKLLNLVVNWKYFEAEEKKKLAEHLENLISTHSYPLPIEVFFTFPAFKDLIANMKEGKLLKRPVEEKEDSTYHPPIEIQNLQILIEAFHKLVHLDFQSEGAKTPFVQAKVYGSNILEYLSVTHSFVLYDGKLVDEILEYLFASIKDFATKLRNLMDKNRSCFSQEFHSIAHGPIFEKLIYINRSIDPAILIDEWIASLVHINIEPAIAIQANRLFEIAVANMHKLINQMSAIFGEKRDFYQRNLPYYKPYELKNAITPLLKKASDKTGKISGQKVNEQFYEFFWQQRYETIAAKQEGINKKLSSLSNELSLIQRSSSHFLHSYGNFLPSRFVAYAKTNLSPLIPYFSYLAKPNFLASSALLGFGSVQCDYALGLLSDLSPASLPKTVYKKIESLLPIIFSFLEQYYQTAPLTSFFFIREYYEHFIKDEKLNYLFPTEEILNQIDSSLELFIPSSEDHFDRLEASFYKIICKCIALLGELPTNSLEHELFKERLEFAKHVDLPSQPQVWYAMGELLSIFYIFASQTNSSFQACFSSHLSALKKRAFVKILFFSTQK